MKNLYLLIIALFSVIYLPAQSILVFHEDFELPTLGDSLQSSTDPAGGTSWAITTHLKNFGLRADSNSLQNGMTVYLTTNSFATTGNNNVILEFSHICKLYYADGGIIEVSVDGGFSWTSIGVSQYQGSGNLITSAGISKFSDNAYSEWAAGSNTIPANSWWRNEKFNISSIAANKTNVKIRFKYTASGNPSGVGRYGWLIDDIKVSASPSEINPPVITMLSYPTDTVYYGGPYNISAYVKDESGLDTVYVLYKAGNNAIVQLGMTKSPTIDSLYSAGIPYVGFGKKVSFNVIAKDASLAHNLANKPDSASFSFFTKYSSGGNVIVGTGTSTQNYPFKSNADNTKSASLYLASVINKFGMITQLQWNVSNVQSAVTVPVKIYIRQTSASVMIADNWNNLINGAVLVYDGSQTFTTNGWKTFVLNTAFNYYSGNLMVLCEANFGGTTGAGSTPSFYYSTGSSGSHQYFASSASATGTITTSRPNITIGFLSFPLLTQDAGISQIVSPTSNVTAGIAFDVNVKIKNYGTAVLTKTHVYYAIDGNNASSNYWTGSLAKDSVFVFTAGNLSLAVGIHTLKTWTDLPNDSIDQNNFNDTAYFSFYPCAGPLNGNYTIGGTSADFASISEAVIGLTQCGINAPVVFNINPGTYSEQLSIPEISGASLFNTITFQSSANDSTSVIMNHASTASSNWIVKMNGADNICFRHIKFSPSDSANSTAIVITNGAINNKFIGNLFSAYAGTAIGQTVFSIEGSTIANAGNLIQGNHFVKGSYAISIKGSVASKLKNTQIKNNYIENAMVYGIYAQFVDSTLIDSNTIVLTNSNINKYGVYLQYGNILNTISKNTIVLSGGVNMYGILTESCISTDAAKGLIANNFISIINGNSIANGIRLNTVVKFNVFANSINVNGNNATDTRSVYIPSSSSGIELKNNNLLSNKYPVYVEGTSVSVADYNNYFSSGTSFVYWNTNAYPDLISLVTASLNDSNSISVNPFFISLTDLHTFNGLLKGMGTPLADITKDIDGNLRLNPPCIGADEFLPPAQDAAFISVLKPNSSCGLSSTEDIVVVIKSVGSSSIMPNLMTLYYKIDNNTVVSELVNRTINPGDTIHYIFSTKANLTGSFTTNDTTFNLKAWINLTGDYAHSNDSSEIFTITSRYLPQAPVVSNVSAFYGTTVMLNAASNKPVFWYDSPSTASILHIGNSYTTPYLLLTDTFYAEANTNNLYNTIIGTASANQTYPFNASWGYTTSASIYESTEIGGFGNINQLGWYVINPVSTNLPIKIYLKQTLSATMVADTWSNLINGAILVYDGTQTFNANGWKSISLTTPFNYTSGNLMVLCEANYGASGSNSPNFAYTTSAAGSHQYSTANNVQSTGVGYTSYSRPDIKINMSNAGCSSARIPVIATITIPAHNAGISSINTPTGCALYQVAVKIKIFNHGSSPLNGSNTTVSYKIDNGNFSTPEAINIVVPPFDTVEYTFTNLANFAAPTADRYIKLTAIVNNLSDVFHSNDTLVKDSILSKKTPSLPTTNNVNIFNGSPASLTATAANANFRWFDQLSGGSYIGQGSPFITPILYASDTFYVEANNDYLVSTTIGNGNLLNTYLTYPTPYGNYNSGSKEQYLILASELQAMGLHAGMITSAAFDVVVPSFATSYGVPPTGSHMINFTMSAGLTTVSSLTSFIQGLTQVYFTPHFIDEVGWNIHNFSTPIYWDGISNVVVQTCFDNNILGTDWSDASAIVNQTTTPFVSTVSYHSNYGGVCTTGGTQISLYSKRPNIKLTSILPGCTSSPRVAVIVNVSPSPQNDAGISALINPVSSATSGVSTPVKIKIKNYGQSHLTNVSVVWSLNNVLKPVYHFTGDVPAGADTIVTIANETFTGGLYCIKAWTKNPNSASIDSIASNDTLASSCFTTCLNGTYTIGDTTGGNYHDFSTFNAAVNALKIGGVCGSVVFLAEIGTYNEQLRIPEIAGASALNTITFRSASNDSTKVKLQFAPISTNSNYILELDSADYIRIEKMTIKSLGTTYGNVIILTNGACNNIISNNIIEMPIGDELNTYSGIYDYFLSNFYNKYLYNKILNGNNGIYTNGASISNPKKGTEIKGNTILNFFSNGIYSWYQDSVKIIANEISTNSTNNQIYGLNIAYNNNAIQIIKNKIKLTTSKSQYGLYLYNCIGTATSRGLIANNMIALTGGNATTTNYGLYSAYSAFQNFYFNSLNTVSPSLNNSNAMYIAGGGSELRLVDNNFVNTGGGFAYYVQNTAAVVQSNYNNLFTNGGLIAYWNGTISSLNDFQAISANDYNSVSVNPLYVSATDLHLLSTSLSNKGTVVSSVTDDIDGYLRDLAQPTIGADEVTLLQHDAGVTFISQPLSIETEAISLAVKVAVKNFGTSPITSMIVSYILNNNPPVDYIYNGALASMATDTITFPSNITVAAGNNTICAYTSLIGDTYTFNNQSCKNFFGTPLYDAQLTSISPIQGGCGLTNSTIQIMIDNQGVMAINGGFTASYQKAGSSGIITEIINTPIPVGGSDLYSFSTPVNLSVTNADSLYRIKVWLNLNNDNIHFNDSANVAVKSLHTPINPVTSNISIPYATSATLSASSNDPIKWYDLPVNGTLLASGSQLVTPMLFASDTFYVESNTTASFNATVGTGTATNTYPFGMNWGFYRSASVYKASEIGGFGIINELQWYVSNSSSINVPVKIYILQTPQTVMTTDTWAHLISNASIVYDGSLLFDATGWKSVNLSNPFNYTSDNLIILCETNSGGSGSSPSALFRYTSSGLGTHQYFTSDNNAPVGNGYLSANRPNIKITGNIAGCSSQRVTAVVNVGSQNVFDAAINSIISPATAVNLTTHDTVKVIIKNYGTSAISNFSVKYRLESNTDVNELITASLASDSSMEYTFNQTVDLSSGSQPQSFNLITWTDLTADATHQNDTIKKTIINNPPNYCISTATSNSDDDIGSVSFAGINHGNPLPVLNNPAANQMYNNYAAISPAIVQPGLSYPISVNAIFSSASYAGKINVYIDYNKNGNWDLPEELVFTGLYNGNGGSTITGTINIPFTAIPGLCRMRIVMDEDNNAPPCGTYTYGETEDYTVKIIPPIPHDGGISKIGIPAFLPYTSSNLQTPFIFIRNYGNDLLTTATINYAVNNSSLPSNIWNGSLTSLSVDSVIQNISLNSGMNSIIAFTSGIAGDTNNANDSLRINVFKEYLTTPPYSDNFESNKYWYASTIENGIPINNLWEQGQPNTIYNSLNAAHSPVNVWVTKLNAKYPINNYSALYSPIFDVSVMQADTLKFWQWRQFGSGANGANGQIEYKNASGSWIQLGVQNDTNATNWYNDASNKWTGSDTNWKQSKYCIKNLSNLGNKLQFRFVFVSGTNTVTMKGWAIDDFELSLLPISNDAGVTAITSPASTSLVGDNVLVTVNVKNFGLASLSNIPVKYQTGNGIVKTATLAGPILPGATTSFSFPQTFQVATQNYSITAYTTVAGDTYTQNDTTKKIVVVSPAINDVAVTEILMPGNYFTSGVIPIKVVVKNFGSQTQTSIPLSYQRGSLTLVTTNWTGSLAGGDSIQFTFPTLMTTPLGNSFSICAFTGLSNDTYKHNDTVCKSVYLCNVANAGTITGPSIVSPGATAVAYTVPAISNATSYNWVYSPATGITINGSGSNVTIDFGNGAVNGVLSVNGIGTNCSGNPSSINIGGLFVNEIENSDFWLGQNMPNPTTGITSIEYSLPYTAEIKFNITNLYGKEEYSFSKKVESGKHQINLNLKNLSAGVYFYAIETNGNHLVKKLIIYK